MANGCFPKKKGRLNLGDCPPKACHSRHILGLYLRKLLLDGMPGDQAGPQQREGVCPHAAPGSGGPGPSRAQTRTRLSPLGSCRTDAALGLWTDKAEP